MRLPRDLSGTEIARQLTRHYGYRVTQCRGSHMTATLTVGDSQHKVTIPRHRDVRVGTLNSIISDVATFLNLPKQTVRDTLFG